MEPELTEKGFVKTLVLPQEKMSHFDKMLMDPYWYYVKLRTGEHFMVEHAERLEGGWVRLFVQEYAEDYCDVVPTDFQKRGIDVRESDILLIADQGH